MILRPKKIITFCTVFFSTMLMWQCTTDGDIIPEPGNSDTEIRLTEARVDMARHLVQNSIIPSYQQLSNRIGQLSSTWIQYLDDPSIEVFEALQLELQNTWFTWQTASIYQMGPTETFALRASMNTYPTSVDKIEDNIARGNWSLGSLDNKDAEGLPALDYLFNGSGATIEERHLMVQSEVNRANYIHDMIEHLKTNIERTAEEWENGMFTANYIGQSASGTDVGSALGLIMNAIDLHFQRYLRDGKVAIPAGVRSAGIPRPKATEAFYGGYSRQLLTTAINSYINMFSGLGVNGQSGSSLTSYLTLIGHQNLANDLREGLGQSLEIANDLHQSFTTQIEQDNDEMIEVFLSLQSVVTLLKSDITSVLGITITNQDNDGD